MALQLPEKPNLEFLKKQAKERLRERGRGRLADAQHELALEYGFACWTKLKEHVEGLAKGPVEELKDAVCAMEAARVGALLRKHAELRRRINEPMGDYGFGAQALYAAVQRSDRATIEVLLEAGADINQKTDWWAGGFGVLDECHPEMVEFLMERGAKMTAHAAARLGRVDELREMIQAEPGVVHERGGDGRTPLHCASTVEIARLLVERGAEIDARCVDHESTPAQYMLRVEQARHYLKDRQEVARYLVERGCKTDLLMAAALGDGEMARRHLEAAPGCIRMSVTKEWFPMENPRAGGTIYIWQLGAGRTAHSVARDYGHEDVFEMLREWTPEDLKLALACELGDEEVFARYLRERPEVGEGDWARLPRAAQDCNNKAVKMMLEAGWPVNARGEMGAAALHWAGFHGNAEMVREILRHGPEIEMKSIEYAGTALAWACFGSGNGWRRETGDYVGAVRALLEAGAEVPEEAEDLEPSEGVRGVLREG